jgi:hypothetical protein
MMTDYEIIHIIAGISLWLLTWELFFGQYFYTRSEKEMIRRARGEDHLGIQSLISNLTILWVMGLVFFKILKYF